MKAQVNIFNPSGCAFVNRKELRTLVQKVTHAESKAITILNIIITDDAYLKKLNKMYFNKNRATNVISFDMDEVSEIYISCDRTQNRGDLHYLVIHGLLHLLGYDHKTKEEQENMESRCLEYLEHA